MLETRRVTEHQARTLENEELIIVTCWEPGVKKEEIKKDNVYSKKHEILYFDKSLNAYEYKNA